MTPTQFYRRFAKLAKREEWGFVEGKLRRIHGGSYACPLAFMARAAGADVSAVSVYPSADALNLSHASAQRIASAADNDGYPRVRAKLLAAIGW